MSNTIRIKRSSLAGAIPPPGSLLEGELAINTADGKLFFLRPSDSSIQAIEGKIKSVNSKTGPDVVLTAADVGAAPTVHQHQIGLGDGSSLKLVFSTDERLDLIAGTNMNIVFNDSTNEITFAVPSELAANASTATKLKTPFTLTLTGDVSGSASIDGSANVSVDAVVADNSHSHTIANVTNLQTALDGKIDTSKLGVASGVATLDATGKLVVSQVPAIAITDTFVVANQTAMLALNAQTGDVAVRSDLNKSFILTASPATTLANWQELLTPTDSVISVNGQTGAVTITTASIGAEPSIAKTTGYARWTGSAWIFDNKTFMETSHAANAITGFGTSGTATTVARSDHNHSTLYQPLDADLTSIAGLSGTTGLLKKTAANTWTLDTSAYLTTIDGLTIDGGTF